MGFNIHILSGRNRSTNLAGHAALAASFNPNLDSSQKQPALMLARDGKPLLVFALTFLLWSLRNCAIYITSDAIRMITAGQIRAARALLGIDQRKLAELSGLSLPTIQRMEASEDTIRGNVDSLMKLVAAFDGAGIELIPEGATSPGGGRGVRLRAR
jgi:DNA-binding XRE family transcriptional regulator